MRQVNRTPSIGHGFACQSGQRGGEVSGSKGIIGRDPGVGQVPKRSVISRRCSGCSLAFSNNDGRRHYCSAECKSHAKAASNRLRQARHRNAHPERAACRQILKNAILAGKIRRPARCEGCGTRCFAEAHHSDYSKPFFVEWLCKKCHEQIDVSACGTTPVHRPVVHRVAGVPEVASLRHVRALRAR